MTLSYINKMIILFLALSSIPASIVGILLVNEASNMADDSEANIKDLGDEATNITTESLKNEGEAYLANKLNETMYAVRDYLSERKSDCKVLANITRTNGDFFGFYQASNGMYPKIAYINSSGHEEIKIENNQINPTLDNVENETYFTETNGSSQGDLYIDNSELYDNTTKHVIRYCVKANDGIVLVELNMSLVVDLVNTFKIRGDNSFVLFSTAWVEIETIEKTTIVMIIGSEDINLTPYTRIDFTEAEYSAELLSSELLGIDDRIPFFVGNLTLNKYVHAIPSFLGGSFDETSAQIAAAVDYENKLMYGVVLDADDFLEPVNETNTVIEEGITESVDDMQSSRDNMLITSVIIIAASVGSALVGALVVGKRLTKRLKDLTKTAERINKGEIDIEVPHRGKDEIGQLAEAFKGLQEGMKYLMQES